mgnify:CR=1 FL=1
MADARHDMSAWPQGLVHMAEIIGPDEALKLADVFGGQRVYIPSRVTEGHPYLAVLTRDMLAKVCASWLAGGWYELPRGPMRDSKNKSIRALLREGHAHRTIARALKVSERHVERIAGEMRREARAAGPQQLSLLS